MSKKLIFVYNANSGAVNSLIGTAHKIISPQTYECNLCALTFGNFTENLIWKEFRNSSNVEMEFLHKDEFLKQYRSKWLPKYEFPIVLIATDNELGVFMLPKFLKVFDTTENLIEAIEVKLKLLSQLG
ncbi:GTPase [Patiriisocius marinus]|uniref:GTPase n=1 Tax=Patiriisocius marinus TaxID=1397112 RepID=A0A5J4J4F3_9FLAO|nr:GTPase [Patiriisocius marinus]GER60681.1 hypothetical protein ULMA_27890 [Patiriisocius marinus]